MSISNILPGRERTIAHHTRTGRDLFAGAFVLSFAGSLAGSLGTIFLSGNAHWLAGSLVGALLTIVAFGSHLSRRGGQQPHSTTGASIDR